MSEPRGKKTTLACDHCRRRKRKCDAQMPTCTTCQRAKVECLYTTNLEHRRPPQKNYVVALEARIAQLEGILKSTEPDSDASPPQPSSETTLSSPTIPPLVLVPEHAADVLQSTLDPTLTHISELDLGMAGYETLISLQLEHKLLAQFWDWQRMHLPYIAPVPFLSAYAIHSELVHPDEPIPPAPRPPLDSFAATALNVPRASTVQRTSDLPQFISPVLLYAMFAIASLFHGDPDTSEMFYERARERLLIEAINPRVATVQAACLMATWELGHAKATAAWTLLGVALSLCIRLGMNVDATPLLQSGAISPRLFETRNFVFWAAFNTERFHATCMGMRPLIDRRIINIPKHSSPTSDTPAARNNTEITSWWSPSTLGMGDVLIQAAWDSIRDLVKMMDDLYAADAATRTPQEILELVARNHLRIQKFIDNLPTWLRSTGAIRRKESGLVYLHLFIHLTAILTNRPFLSSHHPPSSLTRKYRTLAFRVARASALQVSSLIRHIPLSSPCVTMPYIVYSACTILLLAPEDPAAMDGVRTSLTCLDEIDQAGYWVDSAKDAATRVRALAQKWGVGLESSRRVLGLAGTTKPQPSPPESPPDNSARVPEPAMSTRPSTSGTEQNTLGYLDESVFTRGIDAAIDRALQLAQPARTQDLPPLRYHPYKPRSHSHSQHQHTLPHVGYASSHADPEHDMHVTHSHWHTVIPPDPQAHAFPPDPSACADVGACFTYTVEHARDPVFVDQVGDPYAGVSMDWSASGFSAVGVPALVGDPYGYGYEYGHELGL
ncbi:unnamed protein product [Rhizoctonia solani]|uniref:Zn(2)-C6 fungal-type domain-containing protein n=1 Tax=Rhizoctonia solani TaxID=456999 RepID=A0A8H3BHV2_9AGAM|nr:unnamed protein product [Rhizoctonia solani]